MNNLEKNFLKILYISYDGLLEPLGESQVLSYIENLSSRYDIDVISFEKAADFKTERKEVLKKRLEEKKIKWHCLKYHSRPSLLATMFDLIAGFFVSIFILSRSKKRIIHVRSLLPGIMILPLKNLFNFKLIFDMRGFWPDEKADRAGWSRASYKYLLSELFQDRIICASDKIVTLTNQAKSKILNKFPKLNPSVFEVIPTCTDTTKFKLLEYQEDGDFEIVFGHLGSVDTAYSVDPILKMIKNFQKIGKKVKIIFFNKGSHEYIESKVKEYNLFQGTFQIKEVEFGNFSNHLKKIHVGCFFANYSTSIIGSLPTKIGEFLSSGKPIICNPANEDIVEIIKNNKVGLVKELENEYLIEELFISLQALKNDKEMPKRCRGLAESFFSLSLGVKKYNKIYNELATSERR